MIKISSLLSSFSETFWRKSFSYFRFVKIPWRVYKYPEINLRQAPPFANLQTSVNLKRYPLPLSYLISSAAILSQIVLSPAVFLTCPVLSPRKINEKGTPWYYQFILRIDLCGKWLFFLCSQPLSYSVRILFMQIDRLQLKETMFSFQTICLVFLSFCPSIKQPFEFWTILSDCYRPDHRFSSHYCCCLDLSTSMTNWLWTYQNWSILGVRLVFFSPF